MILVPNLRFPEFRGEWEAKKLGEIAKFSKGKGISKSDIDEEGEIECIRYGELYTYYREVITEIKSKTNIERQNLIFSKANDVIIPASGETQLDIATASCVLKSEVALGGDLNIIRTPNNGLFLSYYLNSKKKIEIANLAQGVSVVHLYSSQLASLEVNFPSLEEQNKVASFLTLIDERIQTQNEIIENLESLKKRIGQKLFSKKIRFKDNDGNDFFEWQQKSIDSVFKSFKGKGIPKGDIIENGKKECILYGELYTTYNEVIKNIVSKTNSDDGLPSKKGDLLIPSSTTTTGIDLANVTALNFDNVLLGGDIIVLRSEKTINNVFYAYYLTNYKKHQIASRAQGITIVHLYFNSIKDLDIDLPSYKEQTKIANFLQSLAEKIETEKQLLLQYQNQKKYLLQNLFI
ncbi:restriction endonuclease subunit S [Mariniflexile sp.]|uniref:restriction endonuclease subunit S n=1 Tax=Mariniflexile sp. TaxID=1979402 RepID=UPI004047E9C8